MARGCACRSAAAKSRSNSTRANCPGKLHAAGPGDVNPADYDLVVLAMQEPQYRSPGVRELLDAVARARVPCMSIMNMPPLPYLKRIPGLATDPLRSCYTDATVWNNFEPGLLTLCSPDPQAIRPPGEKINVLQVTLPTNFKAARFEADGPTAILKQMQKEVEAVRYDPGDGPIDLPVKLKVHELIFVPLAKWAMLLTGNYRCVTPDAAIDIKDAVHRDPEASRSVYNWVCEVCREAGRRTRRSGAVREIRRRGERSGAAVLRRAGVVQRRAEYRAHRPPGADDRRPVRHAQPDVDRTVATVDDAPRDQPQSRRLDRDQRRSPRGEDRRISKAWLHRSNNCSPSPGPVELAAIHDWGLLNPIATVPESAPRSPRSAAS